MRPRARERWTIFYSTSDWIEASIVLEILRSAGIPAVQQKTGASLYGAGTISILVPRERMEEAQRVVDSAKDAGEMGEEDNGHYGE